MNTVSWDAARFILVNESFIFLMMEAANTCETFVNFCQSTLRNNPEASRLHLFLCVGII
jgi:hypothetical protein